MPPDTNDFSKWQSVAVTRRTRLLETGPAHRFSDWPCQALPEVAAGVYTLWQGQSLLYVGEAGANWTKAEREEFRVQGVPRGLHARLLRHASGRRGCDPFCAQLCERLLRPRLNRGELDTAAADPQFLDVRTRDYVVERCTFRFQVLDDGALIRRLVARVAQGGLSAGRPLIDAAQTCVQGSTPSM